MKSKNEKIKEYLSVIDEIEKVRTRNNVNWMDILRLAIKNDPDEAIKLLSKVNKEDKSISKLFSKLSD
tara:strand:+ start:2702 stop:2905 length:204 start_codon:yes stop_codon:yes gene_type:complete